MYAQVDVPDPRTWCQAMGQLVKQRYANDKNDSSGEHRSVERSAIAPT